MNETDRDIEELNRLLGPAVSEYRSLEHRSNLENLPLPRRRFVSMRPFSVVAPLLLALALVGFLSIDRLERQNSQSRSPIAFSTSLPGRPAANPLATNIQRPTVSLSRSSLKLTLPSNPVRRGG